MKFQAIKGMKGRKVMNVRTAKVEASAARERKVSHCSLCMDCVFYGNGSKAQCMKFSFARQPSCIHRCTWHALTYPSCRTSAGQDTRQRHPS